MANLPELSSALPELSCAKVSRRLVLLQGAGCAAGVATILVTNANSAKAAKLPPTAVSYRATPNGDKQCSNCKLFEPPNACSKVDGEISPQGWCSIYQKT